MSTRPLVLAAALIAVALQASACAAQQDRMRRPGERDEPPIPPDVETLGKQLGFVAGLRSYEDEGLEEIDEPFVFGIDYCQPMNLRSVRLEGGIHYSYDEGDGTSGGEDVRLKNESWEFSAGLNWSFLVGRVRPYLGLGASFLFLELRGIDDDVDAVFDDDDATVGGYAKAGVLLQITRTSHVGLEFRHFEGGEASLDGTELSTNYDQIVLVLGTSFQ